MTEQLTLETPETNLNAQPGVRRIIATSGPLGATGVLQLEYRVAETDPWVPSPTVPDPATGHFNAYVIISAIYNRLVVLTPDAATKVNVQL